jgi:hypothetical protein
MSGVVEGGTATIVGYLNESGENGQRNDELNWDSHVKKHNLEEDSKLKGVAKLHLFG